MSNRSRGVAGRIPRRTNAWLVLTVVSLTFVALTSASAALSHFASGSSAPTGAGNAPLATSASPSSLQITNFDIQPQTVTVGNSVSFNVQVTGGDPPYSFSWSGLPNGCNGGDQSSWSCSPSSSGAYTVNVQISDSGGNQTQTSGSLSVQNSGNGGSGSNGNNSGGNLSNLFSGLGGILELALLGALVSFFLLVALTVGVLIIAVTLARRLPKPNRHGANCPGCGAVAVPGARFCSSCAAPLTPPK